MREPVFLKDLLTIDGFEPAFPKLKIHYSSYVHFMANARYIFFLWNKAALFSPIAKRFHYVKNEYFIAIVSLNSVSS